MIGWAFRQLAILGAVAMVLYAIVEYRLTQPAGPAPVLAPAKQTQAAVPAPASGAVPNALIFRANKQGHVELNGVVNGTPVRFLVDTGATFVALSISDAAAAGLSGNDLVFRAAVSTANGRARVAPVTLRELRIGQFAADDVPAVVMDNLPISLLGQSFLKRLDGYEMRDGVLTLNWY